ncbi:hypothetical protein [Ruminococcus albus]|uniref:Uncharacterized protein n=1 Tax=Ruminococcus albus TaxID=1264 RepID=A0A1I1PKB3_RUMAL|nr:hypothetical protein [Ruminococcus albus]SFD10166.1 hypothetical protein SAMN02910406_03098 [Ruminococcus albus]
MKDYIVVFMFKGLYFYERTRVYGVNDRRQAIQIVKDHYGSGNIKILSAKIWKE